MMDYLIALLGAAIGATVLSRGWRSGRLVWMGRALTRRRSPVAYWVVMLLAAVLIVHGAYYLGRGWG